MDPLTTALIAHKRGDLDEAERRYRQILASGPYADALHLLGLIFQAKGKLVDAEDFMRRALDCKEEALYLGNLGSLLRATGRASEAEQVLIRALELRPDSAPVRYNLSLLRLAQGRYEMAWADYEFRYHPDFTDARAKVPALPFPQWRGQLLEGKSIVIWPEQGFGDYIQFVRYASELKARGASRITLLCAPELESLLMTVRGIDRVTSQWQTIEAHDYWIFPLSIPRYLNTTIATIPARLPYLFSLPERRLAWQERLHQAHATTRVGLVWRGQPGHSNDANRSLPGLETLASLWAVPGVTFVSLQKGRPEELDRLNKAQPTIDLGSTIRDFADTAAIISQLDLVITVDTAVAHLTGALAKPCWVLLPFYGTDWRWLVDRTDSPWYPGVMRLFRQAASGEWAPVIKDVEISLKDWCQARSAGQ